DGIVYSSAEESNKIKKYIGLMPQGIGIILYNSLTVKQQIDYFINIKHVKVDKEFRDYLDYLLTISKLKDFTSRMVANLSGGMKQKLALVCTLLNKPKALLLDEPTIGIDPIGRAEFWQLLIDMTKREDIISIISTTYIQEADYMDKLILVEEGNIVDCGDKESLISSIFDYCYDPKGQLDDSIEDYDNKIIKTEKFIYSLEPLSIDKKRPGVESIFFVNWLKKKKKYPKIYIDERHKEELPNIIVKVENITKKFGNFTALNQVSLNLNKKEILGLLGPNGAGKTTFMKILLGLLPSDGGKIELLGVQIKDYRDRISLKSHIGYLSQNFALYKRLTVRENLQYFGTLYGVSKKEIDKKIKDFLYMLGIEKWINHLAENISFGTRQRLSLAVALLHEPPVLILDEPTNGVDVVAREFFWEILHKIKRNWDTSIVVSTHYMGEAEYCDRVVLLKEGEKIADDTVNNLYKRFPESLNFEEIFVNFYRDASNIYISH
ncbi:MAG: ATP-binding cassette domain-containing protein, partial [Deferribacterota bacterium]|nr:ATP-binding cassette domain-containing protein [Deferribacterota bacterium]